MKLYLLRHAEATSAELNVSRPLTEKGKQELLKLANFLQPQGVLVNTIFHSGVLRAQQTAELIAPIIAPGQSLEILPALNNIAALSAIIEPLSGWTDDTLLVGHIPVLPALLGELVIKNENAFLVDFQLATCVCLEKMETDRWCIKWVIAPNIIY